jgi:ribosomal protein S18 acetylase RimI-like enzyme
VSEAAAPLEIKLMENRKQLEELLRLRWSESNILIRGQFVRPHEVVAFGAFCNGRLHGLVTMQPDGKVLYLVALNSFSQMRGVGISLLQAAIDFGRQQGMAFLRAIVSNDNLVGMRFYQKRGFRIVAFHRGIIDAMRNVKPSIPTTGLDGIPMRDELELEYEL